MSEVFTNGFHVESLLVNIQNFVYKLLVITRIYKPIIKLFFLAVYSFCVFHIQIATRRSMLCLQHAECCLCSD